MLPVFLRSMLPFGCLLIPASFIAWLHHTAFPAIVIGTRHLWGTQKPLPVGFEFLCRFGFVMYLPLVLIAGVGALSWRFPVLRGPLSVAVCAGILAMVCAVYAFLLATPAFFCGSFI